MGECASAAAALSAVLVPYFAEIGLLLATWIAFIVHGVPGGRANPSRYFDLTHSQVNYGTIQLVGIALALAVLFGRAAGKSSERPTSGMSNGD